jgi:hypothetical protein
MDWLTIIDTGIRYIAYALIIIGIPALIWFNKFWYLQSLKAKEDQIILLKEMQYDRALAIIKAQKELMNKERKLYEEKISKLIIAKNAKEQVINELNDSFKRMAQQLKDESDNILKIRIEHGETGRYVSASDALKVPVPEHIYKDKIKG